MMKIGAGGPQVQTAQEFNLGNSKTAEAKQPELRPEKIGFKDDADKQITASLDKVIKTVDELNKFSVLSNTHLQFQIHDKSKRLIVKVLNDEGEIIREIPPEKALEMLARLQDSTGSILDHYV